MNPIIEHYKNLIQRIQNVLENDFGIRPSIEDVHRMLHLVSLRVLKGEDQDTVLIRMNQDIDKAHGDLKAVLDAWEKQP